MAQSNPVNHNSETTIHNHNMYKKLYKETLMNKAASSNQHSTQLSSQQQSHQRKNNHPTTEKFLYFLTSNQSFDDKISTSANSSYTDKSNGLIKHFELNDLLIKSKLGKGKEQLIRKNSYDLRIEENNQVFKG